MHDLRRVGLLFVLLGFLIGGAWFVRVALIAQSLQSHLVQLEAMALQPDLAPVCEALWATQDDVAGLSRETGSLVALAPLFSWVPVIGNDLRAAPHLLDAADALTDAGSSVCEAFARSGVRDISLDSVMRAFSENQLVLQQASDAMSRAEQAMSVVKSDDLSPPLSSRVASLQRVLPFARGALQAATFTPWLGGFDRPRTYLVLVLNEDELRPGGGFITGVGEVRIEAGHVAAMVFRDSYAVDDFTQPYPDPPEPLSRLLGIDQWVFRDGNWSPDFPTAARQAIELYRPGGIVARVDGVIAIDQLAVQALIAAVGPLQVKESSEPITGQNIIAYIRRTWAPADGNLTGAWWLRRKSFMGPLAEAALSRVETGAFDKIALAQTLLRLIEGKHFQIFVNQPAVAAILREHGWDGALRRTTGDYRMVVDANVGYNKVNARVHQSVTYQVDLRASPPRAKVTLVYTNTSNVNYPCRPETRYDPIYEQMMDRCYWDYVRVYVPASTQLEDATRIPILASALWNNIVDPGRVLARVADEGEFMSFEVPMVLPTASSQTRSYALTLSTDMIEWSGVAGSYSLFIQKQAGTASYPVTVQIYLPQPSVLVDAFPKPMAVEGNKVIYHFQLERDLEFRVRFKRTP